MFRLIWKSEPVPLTPIPLVCESSSRLLNPSSGGYALIQEVIPSGPEGAWVAGGRTVSPDMGQLQMVFRAVLRC